MNKDYLFDPPSPKQPKDFLGNPLLNVCGMREYEEALRSIIIFLSSEEETELLTGYDPGKGWNKLFRISTFPFVAPALFAMMCADGWITANHFPKYTFQLSHRAIQSLNERATEPPQWWKDNEERKDRFAENLVKVMLSGQHNKP